MRSFDAYGQIRFLVKLENDQETGPPSWRVHWAFYPSKGTRFPTEQAHLAAAMLRGLGVDDADVWRAGEAPSARRSESGDVAASPARPAPDCRELAAAREAARLSHEAANALAEELERERARRAETVRDLERARRRCTELARERDEWKAYGATQLEVATAEVTLRTAREDALEGAVNLLHWLQLKGGLGLDVHDRIDAQLLKLTGKSSR